MPNPAIRAICGFLVAAVSVLTFHQAMWEALHLLAIPGMLMPEPYPMSHVIPFGVPRIANYAVWAGLWGAAFGLVLPRLKRPHWPWGLALGLLGAVIGLLIVPFVKRYQPGAGYLSLKSFTTMLTILMTYGLPIGAGLGSPLTWLRSFLIDGSWGFGLGLMLPPLLRAIARPPSEPPLRP
jgi:hypothetical protein